MRCLILGIVAVLALALVFIVTHAKREGFQADTVKSSPVTNNFHVTRTLATTETTPPMTQMTPDETILSDYEIPEDTLKTHMETKWEELAQVIDEKCENPLKEQLQDLVNKPFSLIWSNNGEGQDANRVLPVDEYNADVHFYAYGDHDTLQTYQEHLGALAGQINDAQAESNVPVIQDPRCSFVKENLKNSDKFIFFNNNKLLSHPDGPMEPNLCYIPPHVANVLYHDQLCTPKNELIYNKRFEDIVEIQGLDVSARVDKDIGTPMCVLRFKTQAESKINNPKEYKEKLEEYLQYLYKMDPERQYWRESTQWLLNKNYDDQKTIAHKMADKEWLNQRLIDLQAVLDSLRMRVGLRVDPDEANENDGYMQDPSIFIHDYITGTVDGKAVDDIPENRVMSMVDASVENSEVGGHLIDLQESSFENVVNKWAGYADADADEDRAKEVAGYVNTHAKLSDVWDRASENDKHQKEEQCESILFQPEEGSPRGWLGFRKIQEDESNPANTNHFLLREDGYTAETHYRNMCEWDDLVRIDGENEGKTRRSDSCDWATGYDDNGFNCYQYEKLFDENLGVHNYFEELANARGESVVKADKEIADFLVYPGRNDFSAFFRSYDAKGESTCVYRESGAVEGACESVHDDRFPIPPRKTQSSPLITLKGKGTIDQSYRRSTEEEVDRTGDTNFHWGPNLIVIDRGDGGVSISGRPATTFEEKLQPALITSDTANSASGETTTSLSDNYEIVLNDVSKKLVYVDKNKPVSPYLSIGTDGGSESDYTPPTAKCYLDKGMMIVKKDIWVKSPDNIVAAEYVKKGLLDTQNYSDPKDSTVTCELDWSNDVFQNEYLKVGRDSNGAVTLAPYTCDLVSPSPNETVHIDTGSATKKSVISPRAGNEGAYHTFEKNQDKGEFPVQTQAGYILLNSGGDSQNITVSGTAYTTPVSINPAVYTINEGVFSKIEGTYKIEDARAEPATCASDDGPGSGGLFYYTAPDTKTQVSASGFYRYIEQGNTLEKIDGDGVKYFNTQTATATPPTCQELQKASESCDFANTECVYKSVGVHGGMGSQMGSHLTETNENGAVTYDVRQDSEVFDISGKNSGGCYQLNLNPPTIGNEGATPTQDGAALLDDDNQKLLSDDLTTWEDVCQGNGDAKVTYRYLGKGSFSGEKSIMNDVINIQNAMDMCTADSKCRGFDSGFNYVSRDISKTETGDLDLYQKMISCVTEGGGQ